MTGDDLAELLRALVEQHGLRAHADQRRATEVDVAVHALDRMSEFGRPSYVRTA